MMGQTTPLLNVKSGFASRINRKIANAKKLRVPMSRRSLFSITRIMLKFLKTVWKKPSSLGFCLSNFLPSKAILLIFVSSALLSLKSRTLRRRMGLKRMAEYVYYIQWFKSKISLFAFDTGALFSPSPSRPILLRIWTASMIKN